MAWDPAAGVMACDHCGNRQAVAPAGTPVREHAFAELASLPAKPVAKLGTAFQLTNFIRDVTEDYGLDRVYLPVEDRARHGVTVQDIAARRMTDGLRALLALEVTRARHVFAATSILDDALDPAFRPGVRLARSVYERVLDRVEALGFDVLRHRVRVPPWQLGAVAVAALSTTGRREREPGLRARQ